MPTAATTPNPKAGTAVHAGGAKFPVEVGPGEDGAVAVPSTLAVAHCACVSPCDRVSFRQDDKERLQFLHDDENVHYR